MNVGTVLAEMDRRDLRDAKKRRAWVSRARELVAERDGRRCSVCGRPLDLTVTLPSRDAVVLDFAEPAGPLAHRTRVDDMILVHLGDPRTAGRSRLREDGSA